MAFHNMKTPFVWCKPNGGGGCTRTGGGVGGGGHGQRNYLNFILKPYCGPFYPPDYKINYIKNLSWKYLGLESNCMLGISRYLLIVSNLFINYHIEYTPGL